MTGFANAWAEKSYRIANQPGYLDRLSEVYRVDDAKDREVPEALVEKIRAAYDGKQDARLVENLFLLKKKPIDEPYMRLLQLLPDAVRDNPETVRRIARQHYSLSWTQLEGAIRAPIVANRQLGSRFSEWLKNLEGYDFLGEEQLLRRTKGVAFLAGSDTVIKRFAERHLDYGGVKKPDLLAKCGSRYVLGEAKFFGDTGGNQNNQLKDAMSLVDSQGAWKGEAMGVAILDGVVWLRRGGKNAAFKTVSSTKHDVISALLLPEYLKSLT